MPIPFEDDEFNDDDIEYFDDKDEYDDISYEAMIDWDAIDEDFASFEGSDSDSDHNFDFES